MDFIFAPIKNNKYFHMSKDKLYIEIIQIYWIMHAIIIFNMSFYGVLLPIVSMCIIINYILKWIVPNQKYVKTYSIVMIIYSVIYAILNCVLLAFFKQSIIMLSGMLFIMILNFVISITTFIKYRKWYNFD